MQVRVPDLAGLEDPGLLDAPSIQEISVEIHRRATREQLDALLAALACKSAVFAALLEPAALAAADEAALRRLLGGVFATRRRPSAVLGTEPAGVLAQRIEALLRGPEQLPDRFDAFCAALPLDPLHAADLAAELLHFSAPDVHPLWARWIYNPDTRTGALPLLLGDDVDLEAEGLGATYLRVSAASRLLDGAPEVAGLHDGRGDAFAADVFLVGAYSVYMSTVLGLKMTQEFNAIVPALPELARRLLGVHRMEL